MEFFAIKSIFSKSVVLTKWFEVNLITFTPMSFTWFLKDIAAIHPVFESSTTNSLSFFVKCKLYLFFISFNAYKYTSSIHELGKVGERTKSVDELAQSNKVLLNPTTAGENLENA